MYIDNFYLPKFDFSSDPDMSGFIPDKNALPYDTADDLRMQQAINDDLSQQLHNYIQKNTIENIQDKIGKFVFIMYTLNEQ